MSKVGSINLNKVRIESADTYAKILRRRSFSTTTSLALRTYTQQQAYSEIEQLELDLADKEVKAGCQ